MIINISTHKIHIIFKIVDINTTKEEENVTITHEYKLSIYIIHIFEEQLTQKQENINIDKNIDENIDKKIKQIVQGNIYTLYIEHIQESISRSKYFFRNTTKVDITYMLFVNNNIYITLKSEILDKIIMIYNPLTSPQIKYIEHYLKPSDPSQVIIDIV